MSETESQIELPMSDINTNEKPSEEWIKCCRICHSKRGRMIQICECKGSLAYVHQKCQLQWLQVKKNNKCEICDTDLNVKRVHKGFKDWITLRENTYRVYLIVDIICAAIIFPIFVWTYYVVMRCTQTTESLAIIIMLLISLLLLFVMCFEWGFVCILHHMTAFGQWRNNEYKFILKALKKDNGADNGSAQSDSVWRSLFRWFKSSDGNDANPQQINQI